MVFANSSDEFIIEQMNMHFSVITGGKQMRPKKDLSPAMTKKWENELSFLNFMAFLHSFREASKRNLLNPAEMKQGQQILDLIGA